MKEMPNEILKLLENWQVETEFPSEGLHHLLTGEARFGGQHVRGVAGGQPEKKEICDQNDEHGRNCMQRRPPNKPQRLDKSACQSRPLLSWSRLPFSGNEARASLPKPPL